MLGQHLDQLLSGVGTVIVVEGGAGMGKSRLLREVAAMAAACRFGSAPVRPTQATRSSNSQC